MKLYGRHYPRSDSPATLTASEHETNSDKPGLKQTYREEEGNEGGKTGGGGEEGGRLYREEEGNEGGKTGGGGEKGGRL